MKMLKFRPCYSLRMLLTLVLIVALGCGLWVRSRDLSMRAGYHLGKALNMCFYIHMFLEEDGTPRAGSNLSEPVSPSPQVRKLQYHYQMALKYFDAASNPWLPVEPDPTEPP